MLFKTRTSLARLAKNIDAYLRPVVLLFNAQYIMARLVLHMFVMLTFGLAAPYLAVVVAASLLSEVLVVRVLVGRYISKRGQSKNTCSSFSENNLHSGGVVDDGRGWWRSDVRENVEKKENEVEWKVVNEAPGVATAITPPLLRAKAQEDSRDADMRLLACSDVHVCVKGIWRYPHQSVNIVLGASYVFWALLSFDMIGDINGPNAAVESLCLIMACAPLLT